MCYEYGTVLPTFCEFCKIYTTGRGVSDDTRIAIERFFGGFTPATACRLPCHAPEHTARHPGGRPMARPRPRPAGCDACGSA